MGSHLLELIGLRAVHPYQTKSGEKSRGPEEIAGGRAPSANKGLDKMILCGECDRPGAGSKPARRDGQSWESPWKNARDGESPPMAARGTQRG